MSTLGAFFAVVATVVLVAVIATIIWSHRPYPPTTLEQDEEADRMQDLDKP